MGKTHNKARIEFFIGRLAADLNRMHDGWWLELDRFQIEKEGA